MSDQNPFWGGGPGSSLIPEIWNEADIRQKAGSLERQPERLKRFLAELKDRFILPADHWTARKRVEFLKTLVEGLTIASDAQELMEGLYLRSLELGGKEERVKRRAGRVGLEEDLEDDKVRLEHERVQKKRQELKKEPEPPKRKPSAEKIRQKRRAKVKRMMLQLDRQQQDFIQEITQGKPEGEWTEHERERVMRFRNSCDDKRDELDAELAKWL